MLLSSQTNGVESPGQWPLLRLRRRMSLTSIDNDHNQGWLAPSLQYRRTQNSYSAYEVVFRLDVRNLKLGNPRTGRKIFGLEDAIPMGECPKSGAFPA